MGALIIIALTIHLVAVQLAAHLVSILNLTVHMVAGNRNSRSIVMTTGIMCMMCLAHQNSHP